MLVRRLLRDRLGLYYAQPAHAVVGAIGDSPQEEGARPPRPSTDVSLPFSSLWGEWHWKRLCRRLYEDQKGQWLTPVELFRPHYSRAVARWAAATTSMIAAVAASDDHNPPAPWEMIEVGGGRGTNAAIILDYLKARHPDLYEACVRYTMVDASPTLHELQRNVLRQTSHRHKLKFRLLDLVDVAEGKESLLRLAPSDDDEDDGAASHHIHTVVLALEVLDNLPHDKVRRIRRRPAMADVEWEQAEVDGTALEPPVMLREVFRPLSDPLLRQILLGEPGRGSYGSMTAKPTRPPQHTSLSGPVTTMWIPSVACGVILSLARDLQQSHLPARSLSLLAADFDWLPPPDRFDPRRSSRGRGSGSGNENHPAGSTYMASMGEPLVTCMDGYDHSSYLDAPVLSDILFPTDFGRLAEFGSSAFGNCDCRVDVRVDKQADFLRRHDDPDTSDIDRTKSWLTGYTPLLEDFTNCSVLTMNVACARE